MMNTIFFLLVLVTGALASERLDVFPNRKSGGDKDLNFAGYDEAGYDSLISMDDDDYHDNEDDYDEFLYTPDKPEESSIESRACANQCDKKCYNPLTHQCCTGIVLNGYWSCSQCAHKCDTRCYPKNKGYKCCFGKVIPDAWQCCPHHCAGTCYKGETQKCCHNQIIPRSKVCCKHYCGDNCYDPKNDSCCNGQVIDKKAQCCSIKCGNVCYDKATKKCCHNNVIPVGQKCCPSAAHRVCGNACYSPSTHKCCHNKLIPVGQKCCPSAAHRVCGNACYSSSTHKCCHNKVIPVGQKCCPIAAHRVCGNACYSPSTHKCCHNNVIPVGQKCCPNAAHRVCGNACYSPRTHKCCHHRIIPKGHKCCRSKCGQVCIDTNVQHCCHQRIAPKSVPCLSGSGRLLRITTGLNARSVGCFRDTWHRAIPTLERKSHLLTGPYRARRYAIEKCALAAARRGWRVFALQHQGWCASSPTAARTYKKYGRYNTCRNGNGGPWGNDVYVLEGNAAKKTTKGDICVFPFIYKGKHYRSCTNIDRNRPWCAVTPNYDVDRLWGYC